LASHSHPQEQPKPLLIVQRLQTHSKDRSRFRRGLVSHSPRRNQTGRVLPKRPFRSLLLGVLALLQLVLLRAKERRCLRIQQATMLSLDKTRLNPEVLIRIKSERHGLSRTEQEGNPLNFRRNPIGELKRLLIEILKDNASALNN
jgi:hypothetical protein